MKKNNSRSFTITFKPSTGKLLTGALVLIFMMTCSSSFAYERYNDGCNECHGDFNDTVSTKGSLFPPDNNNKHDMHRYTMGTACNLCHSSGDQKNPYIGFSNGTDANPPYGCTGCHDVDGLRAHHMINNVVDRFGDNCSDCHGIGTPPDENIKPAYYGTVDTLADNSCNDVLESGTNENWTVGDFIGLDNDGDGLYDLSDYSCGPLKVVRLVPAGNDLRVVWETAGGRQEIIQQTGSLTNAFSDRSSTVQIGGVGVVTQEVVLVNEAVDSVSFYKIRSAN